MAFSNLTSYSQAEWDRLQKTPVGAFSSSTVGTPDPNVTIRLGGWVSDTVLAFTTSDTVNDITGLGIASDANTLNVNVGDGAAPAQPTLYYTVDVGSDDGRTTSWSIAFATVKKGTSNGKYVFSKPKDEHPDTRYA